MANKKFTGPKAMNKFNWLKETLPPRRIAVLNWQFKLII